MDTQPQDSWWVGPQPPEGLVQGLASVPAWQFAKILLPLTVVFLITFVLEYRAEVGADHTRLLTHEASVVQDSVSRVEGGL